MTFKNEVTKNMYYIISRNDHWNTPNENYLWKEILC